jgi:AcrR family transcriptional regulator
VRSHVTTTREQNRADTLRRIVEASRKLVTGTGEMTLRSVATEVGMTAPALYRYVDSHEDLVRIVAMDIDAAAAAEIAEARDAQPADDPAARMIASAIAFRQWALRNREEFSLVFTNLDVSCIEELNAESKTGLLFSELLFQVWSRYRFPVPRLDDLDPDLVEILRDPVVPADLTGVPDELRPLIWLLERAWAGLYGTVTLEVFGHIDPRIVEKALLFRAMLEDQAVPLGLADELPRLRDLMAEMLAPVS